MNEPNLGGATLWQWGPLNLTDTLLSSVAVSAVLVGAAMLLVKRWQRAPDRWQSAAEIAVVAAETAIAQVLPAAAIRPVLPFIATLWGFVLVANLLGLIPGLHAPTRDLSATAALAVLVFAATHTFGIRTCGWRAYLRHYLQPSPLLLPFHLLGELTRTLALAIRLFGNIMSLEMAALLLLLVAGFLVPVPLLVLHVVEAIVQAYIFGMLALIYIAGALESHASNSESPHD